MSKAVLRNLSANWLTKHIRCGIIHFNDVYHVSAGNHEPVGGASRFTSAVRSSLEALQQQGYNDSFVLFSGDAFSPSTESSITRGKHMPAVLNELGIHAACVGNHDFDFGLPQLKKLINCTNFPWLLSNVLDRSTNQPPEGIQKHLIVVCKKSGLRIGLVGLVEEEWIATIPSRFPPELEYHDFITAAKELSKELRDPNGPYHVDLVVALTHMRVPNDIKLSKTCQGVVDLVLGGHDHFYYLSKAVNIVGENWSRQQNLEELGFDPEQGNDPCDTLYVIKSGTDFRELSLLTIDIEKDQSGKCVVTAVSADRKPITSDMKVDEKTEGLVQDIAKTVSTKTAYAIGYTMTALDGRSSAVRTKETTLGNITSDLMMNAYNSRIGQVDAAFCCGGTFRSDKIHGPGPVTIGDILDIFPYEDPVVVIKVTGQQLWDALENSVSEYPKQEGRFPQLAGLRIEWNPSDEPGRRLRKVYCMKHSKKGVSAFLKDRKSPFEYEPAPIQSSKERYAPENMIPLDLNEVYWIATREYMSQGYDGYTALKVDKKDTLIDDEQGVIISTLFRRFFLGLKYVNALQDSLTESHNRNERVKELVMTTALKWRQKASSGTKGGDAVVPNGGTGHQKAHHHCSTAAIRKALSGSVQGHPSCIGSESDEEEEEQTVKPQDESHWVQRWASIAPSIDGRIIEVDY